MGYPWAHDIGSSAGSNEANTAQNPYNFGAEYGNNNFDIRHSANFAALYDLPVGRGKRFGKDMEFRLVGFAIEKPVYCG